MARPRVFVSSTCYDLHDIRDGVRDFIEMMGFEPVNSERGEVPYSPGVPLDESCYAEVGQCDICVLIVGRRYGSPASNQQDKTEQSNDRSETDYLSVTRREFRKAVDDQAFIHVFVKHGVLSEYHTFRENRNTPFKPAHADSLNVYRFLDEIHTSQPGIAIIEFKHLDDITNYLRQQWAGLFRQMLQRRRDETQLASLNQKVEDLRAVAATLEQYSQQIVKKVVDGGERVIEEQESALRASRIRQVAEMGFVMGLANASGIQPGKIAEALLEADTLEKLAVGIGAKKSDRGPRWYDIGDMNGLPDDVNVQMTLSLDVLFMIILKVRRDFSLPLGKLAEQFEEICGPAGENELRQPIFIPFDDSRSNRSGTLTGYLCDPDK